MLFRLHVNQNSEHDSFHILLPHLTDGSLVVEGVDKTFYCTMKNDECWDTMMNNKVDSQ